MKSISKPVIVAAFLASLLVTSSMSGYSGAIYTSYGDGTTVNGNNYDNCEDVYLNGGPQNQNASGLPDGIYYFQVTNPSGSDLLSDTPASERRVQVVGGVISGRAPGLDPLGYTSEHFHQDGAFNGSNNSTPVQLWHFNQTPNNGGVYKVWLIPVDDAVVDEDGIGLIFDNNNAKTDNFRCVHDDGGGGGSGTVVIFGRKYYDANGNGVYDGGEEWNTADGRPVVTIDVSVNGGPAVSVQTDDTGLWFLELDENSTFDAHEEVPAGYNQTGPLDGANVSNGSSSATASGMHWQGTVTNVGLSDLNFGNVDITIGGVKFYDANANGVNDDTELIAGIKIVLAITVDGNTTYAATYTDDAGVWAYQVPVGALVEVCEELPAGTWIQTAPAEKCYSFTATQNRTDLDFGNVCLGAGGGLTLGFWSNKNGEAKMKDDGGVGPELALLSGLNLRTANGSAFDPATYASFRTWILNATATNMAYMLSAQLAAMELNVEGGYVSGGSLVYNACTDSFTTITALMDDANASLGADGYTVASGTVRSYQECLKTTLDKANNNKNFVQAHPCAVTYPE